MAGHRNVIGRVLSKVATMCRRMVLRLALALVSICGLATGVAASEDDVDARLGSLLASLKQEIVRQDPARASGRAVVANFTLEGLPWGSPLGAMLQERVARLVDATRLFRPAAVAQTRGITVKQVTGVSGLNESKSLTSYYGSELAIDGSYRVEGNRVLVRLSAVDGEGRVLAQARGEVSMRAMPESVTMAEMGAQHTSQLLDSFAQLGPRAHGASRVEITTSRPGAGASFRKGEEIRYFVTATTDGWLYIFHIDADRKMVRIFPNQFQREARITAGAAVEVPGPGAPFRFEAAPPFGLETTFAIVTPIPLDEKDFQPVGGGFAKPTQDVPALVAARGLRVPPIAGAPAGGASTPSGDSSAPAPLVWNSITVLIRP